MAITLNGSTGITSPGGDTSTSLSTGLLTVTGSTVPVDGMYLPTTNTLAWATNSLERLRLDALGNLGLGVTPSAWSFYRAFDIGPYSSLSALGAEVEVNSNAAYLAGTGWTYKQTGLASQYRQTIGQHRWYTATSGTAGNAISFTQAMTLDASGNLLVGNTSTVNSPTKGLFYATSAFNVNTYNPLELGSASGATVNHQLQKTTVSTSATVILSTGLYASLVVVFGSDGTNRFIDLVLFGLGNGAVGVVSSFSASGAPAARTYSQSSSTYRLAMASGTYTVQAYAMSMNG